MSPDVRVGPPGPPLTACPLRSGIHASACFHSPATWRGHPLPEITVRLGFAGHLRRLEGTGSPERVALPGHRGPHIQYSRLSSIWRMRSRGRPTTFDSLPATSRSGSRSS